jgi:hypothetical protein
MKPEEEGIYWIRFFDGLGALVWEVGLWNEEAEAWELLGTEILLEDEFVREIGPKILPPHE